MKNTKKKKKDPVEILAVTVTGRAGWAVVTQGKAIFVNVRSFDYFQSGKLGTDYNTIHVYGRLRPSAGSQAFETVVLASGVTPAEADQVVRSLYNAAITP